MTDHTRFNKARFEAFASANRPGPIHMLNLISLHPSCTGPEGETMTGAEAYAAYGRLSHPVFERLGGKIVWSGTFEMNLIGPDDDELWDICFIAEYPSVEAFTTMIADPDYRKAMAYRQVAVKNSRLTRMAPRDPGKGFG